MKKISCNISDTSWSMLQEMVNTFNAQDEYILSRPYTNSDIVNEIIQTAYSNMISWKKQFNKMNAT